MIPSDLMPFWLTLGRPLTRLLFARCIGLLIANTWNRCAGHSLSPAFPRRWCGSPGCCEAARGVLFHGLLLPSRRQRPAVRQPRQGRNQPAPELVLANLFNSRPPTWSIADHAVHALARARRSRPYLYGADPRGGRAADRSRWLRAFPPAAPSWRELYRVPAASGKSHPQERRAQGMENGSAAACPSSSCSPSPCTSPCT